jgi:hypothetical protein
VTYQQQLEIDRESLRQQLAIATEPNRIAIGYSGELVGAMCRDKAGRITLATLTDDDLETLIAQALEAKAKRVRRDEPCPTTERAR